MHVYLLIKFTLVSLALTFFSSSPLYPSEYSHMLHVSVNHCGNPLCNERTYQP